MLRLALPIIFGVAPGGCSVAPGQAWQFDPTKPQPRPAVDAARVAPLTNRVVELSLYRQEHRIGRELLPLHRKLGQYVQSR